MTIATRKTTAHQLRRFLKAIRDGIPTTRAADSVGLDPAIVDEPRMANAVRIAEVHTMKRWLATVNSAGEGYSVTETAWQDATQATANDGAPAAPQWSRVRGTAQARTRAWVKAGDWRATAFLLERRFPAEYGAQQPQQVASAVVDVLHALAALRDQPATLAVHKPLTLPAGKTVDAGEHRPTT